MFRNGKIIVLRMVACIACLVCVFGCSDDADSGDNLVPDDIPALVDTTSATVERDLSAPGPGATEVDAFTRDFTAFFKDSDYFKWLSRYSQGLPEDNQWGQPGYKVWWTNAFASRHGDLVTITWDRPSDNSTAKVSRALAPAAGLLLATGDQTLRDLVLGYIRGLSANYDGMVWAGKEAEGNALMARCIFQQSYETELDEGRRIAVDYDSVRYEIIERRHDTVHNPNNPTYGDIYVRNKRSKDDFPYLYRDMPWLIRLIWESNDNEVRDAAIVLFRQVRAMAQDIVDHEYCIRTRDGEGNAFIPLLENGGVDDFATFTSYEALFPLAECTGKMATAYMAAEEPLGNECISDDVDYYGHGGGYEDVTMTSHFWGTNMIFGYHVTALSLALAFGDHTTAGKLLEGMTARIDGLMHDERSVKYTEWWPDVAQLLVQAAAYGMPLTGDEARLIQQQYREAMVFYNNTVPWDIWDASVPEDTPYPVLPERRAFGEDGEVVKTYVRPTEILNPFEYCASPLRAKDGAQFVDCDLLMNPQAWAGSPR